MLIDTRLRRSAARAVCLFLFFLVAGVASATGDRYDGEDDPIFASGFDEVFPPYPSFFPLIVPDSAVVGVPFNVSWNVSGAAECTGSAGTGVSLPGWTDVFTPTSPRSVTASMPGTYGLRLICSNAAGSAFSLPVNVTVIAGLPPMPPGFALIAPDTVDLGAPFDVAWSVTGATSCSGSARLNGTAISLAGWTDVATTTSPRSVTVAQQGTYLLLLNCSNAYGSAISTPALILAGGPPVPPDFVLTPSTMYPVVGEAFTVGWQVLRATACVGTAEIDGHSVALRGWTDTTSPVSPRTLVADRSDYFVLRLTCSNDSGLADSQPIQIFVGRAGSDP
ncbi:MAG TPA: hypothetical protein VHC92_15715 [Rhodanobacteraceae bacterium]|jgi:hypothetical protein|nr:hypothetical protein [Rhodanobacteraceae bacterium]